MRSRASFRRGLRRSLTAVLQSVFRREADGAMGASGDLSGVGNGVLVVGRLLYRGRVKDESNEVPFLHEDFVRDGKIVRIREYLAESEA